ncbi:hypothetical protein ElyMa_000483000 [Elysia marginata]|uniref:Uncharacterized protein n=1 Tax=Elysia marginata TaxID=1093978 RepID=A0AAV4FTI6_9GAST|nr:hypothetical protein ElyMa_000483000 [Elysia marginata]
MDVLAEKENLKANIQPVKQSSSEERDMPDCYPEPDSSYTSPQLHELNVSSINDREDKSVLRLQPLHVMENEDSLYAKALYPKVHSRQPANSNTPQVSISSDKPTLSSSALSVTTLAPCSTSAQKNGDNDSTTVAAEMADSVEDTMRKPLPRQTSQGQRRPGVILLGRGNSFSLGRSEVIFLHNTKRCRRFKGQMTQQSGTGGISNGTDNHINEALHNPTTSSGTVDSNAITSSVFSPTCDPPIGTSNPEPGRPSPPPLSNQVYDHSGGVSVDIASHDSSWPITFRSGKTTEVSSPEHLSGVCHPNSNISSETSTVFAGHGGGDSEELAALWGHAELIMAGKQRTVLDVLAQFGVGEGGENTKDEEEEEESVWQVIENKAHALDR